MSDSLYADNTPPQPVTGLEVTGGHNVIDLAWNSLEPNRIGTDEFIGLSRKMGWTPMLTVNLGTGSGAIAVALLAASGERAAVRDGIGLVERSARLPDGQPVGVALAHLAPRAEVVGRQGSQHHATAVQPDRRVRPGGVAQHHQGAACDGWILTVRRSRRRMTPSITALTATARTRQRCTRVAVYPCGGASVRRCPVRQ